MKERINFVLGALAIIWAATLWSLDWALFRPKFYEFPPINIVFLEHFLWAIILSPFIIKGWKKIKNMKRKDIFSLLWICFFLMINLNSSYYPKLFFCFLMRNNNSYNSYTAKTSTNLCIIFSLNNIKRTLK